MGRRGWGGSPPTDDDEARKRIIGATVRCLERVGPAGTTVANVAEELQISRRTIYRYFASTEELFAAVAEIALESWVGRMESATAGCLSAAEVLVERTAYVIEQLPTEPLLTLLLTGGYTEQFSRRMLGPVSVARCRTILVHTQVDWYALGYDDPALDELVELLLRVIQSMVIAPPDPPRSSEGLRAYLRTWVVPTMGPAASSSPDN